MSGLEKAASATQLVLPKIIADFWAEYLGQFRQMLLRRGVSVTGSETDDQVVLAYFNRQARHVTATPRVVHQPPGFSVPPKFKGYEDAVAAIRKAIVAGVDITPRMSRKLQRWDYVDGMLADFGIQHLHLGTTLDADGFYAQGVPLLYVRFDEANAYFLIVADHGEWANVDLIEIIHANWPGSIERCRIQHGRSGSGNVSDQERMAARQHGIDVKIKMKDGTVYSPPGGGFSASGDTTAASMQVLANRHALNQHEAAMKERVAALLVAHPENVQCVRIYLVMDDQEARAVEPITGLNEVLWKST
jgi:hypothetical protein